MSKSKINLSYIVALVLGMLLMIGVFQIIQFASADTTSVIPTTIDPVSAKLLAEIDEYNKALQSKTLSEQMRSSIEAKLKYVQDQATQRAVELSKNTNSLNLKMTEASIETASPSIASSTKEVRPVGIFDDPPSSHVSSDAVFSTVWIQAYQDTYIRVYAGELIKDREQGIVVVVIEGTGSIEKFLVPGKTGGIKIAEAKGTKLVLISKLGGVIYFDVATKQFFDSSEEILPTITPQNAVIETPNTYPAP